MTFEFRPEAQLELHTQGFHVPRSPLLRAFRDFMRNWPATLETSVKIHGDVVHADRFVLYSPRLPSSSEHHSPRESFHAARNFIVQWAESNGLALDESLLHEIIDERFDFSKVVRTFIGFDQRATPKDSRIKLWLSIEDYPAIVDRVVAVSGRESDIRSLLVEGNVLFGFDFDFSGGTEVKIYAHLDGETLRQDDLRKTVRPAFGHRLNALADMCTGMMIHFYIKRPGRVIIFHFHQLPNHDVDRFMETLEEPRFEKAYSVYRGKRLLRASFSLDEDEIAKGEYSIMNQSYYGLWAARGESEPN